MSINEDINDALGKANRKEAREQIEKTIREWHGAEYSLKEVHALIDGSCLQMGFLGLALLYKLWATEIYVELERDKQNNKE